MNQFANAFTGQVARYQNTAECNDRVHAEYTRLTADDAVLRGHREHVEAYKLGYGDAAFHAMWQQLLAAAADRFRQVDALEIGVFKGQVVSLWALLARVQGWDIRIHGLTPFEGQPLPARRWWRSILVRASQSFRERIQSGDFYPEDDYEEIVRRHFAHHGLAFDAVNWIRGYSTDPAVLAKIGTKAFHVVYVDGGHTFEAATADIANFAPRIPVGGWIVMDDAAYDLPGTTFWKGYESVARACHALPALGFRNVLNVGHNRVFERIR